MKASATSTRTSSCLSLIPSAKPLKICDKITPELPRAPSNNPLENALANSPQWDVSTLTMFLTPLALSESKLG